jgi:putative spermidine/putrescine transport system substrate-binding protein
MRTRRPSTTAFLTRACLTALLYALPTTPVSARDLMIAMPSGGLAEATQAILFKSFIQSTGIPAALARPDDQTADIRLMRGDLLRAACRHDLLDQIDWDRLGGKARFLPLGVQTCGLGAVIVTTVLAWDRDKYPATPTWQDFWDIAKLPGKRGLRDCARGTLEIALMADGVAPGEVYKALQTDDGVARAFRKLDQLRPYIVWSHSGIDAARILGRGDVLLSAAPNGEVAVVARQRQADGSHRNLGLQWNNSLVSVLSWAVWRSSDEQDQAGQFLKAAADASLQAALQELIPYGGIAIGANDNLPPDVGAASSGTPAHLAAGLPVDEAFWRDNLDKLSQRFEAWSK